MRCSRRQGEVSCSGVGVTPTAWQAASRRFTTTNERSGPALEPVQASRSALFTFRDRLPGRGYDPLGLSRYAYVEGNPIDRTDPTGHWSLGGIWSAVTHTVSRAVSWVRVRAPVYRAPARRPVPAPVSRGGVSQHCRCAGPRPSGGESIPVEERSGGMTIDVPIRLSFGEGFSILEPGPSMLINVAPDLGDRISLVFAKQGASRAKGAPKEDDIAGPSKRDWSAGRKRLTPGEIRRLEKAGYDAESIKDDVGAAGKHDLFKDSDGNIYVHPRMVLVLVSQLV